jgi:hypothetical protein
LLEYIVKSTDPKSHIQLCEIISSLYIEILDDGFYDNNPPFYAWFRVKSQAEDYEIFNEFPGITIEIPSDKLIK